TFSLRSRSFLAQVKVRLEKPSSRREVTTTALMPLVPESMMVSWASRRISRRCQQQAEKEKSQVPCTRHRHGLKILPHGGRVWCVGTHGSKLIRASDLAGLRWCPPMAREPALLVLYFEA